MTVNHPSGPRRSDKLALLLEDGQQLEQSSSEQALVTYVAEVEHEVLKNTDDLATQPMPVLRQLTFPDVSSRRR